MANIQNCGCNNNSCYDNNFWIWIIVIIVVIYIFSDNSNGIFGNGCC